MNGPSESELETRASILQLLADGEVASVSTMESGPRLRRGDEYLDLEHLQRGVQRADGNPLEMGHVLPRKAVHEDTWRRLLRRLKAANP